jgi:hypothetical protein
MVVGMEKEVPVVVVKPRMLLLLLACTTTTAAAVTTINNSRISLSNSNIEVRGDLENKGMMLHENEDGPVKIHDPIRNMLW